MSLLQEAIAYYRERKSEEKNKKRLINSKSDFHLLEELIQKCNENPALKIAVFMRDGTRLELKTYEPPKKRDYELINGDYIEIHG